MTATTGGMVLAGGVLLAILAGAIGGCSWVKLEPKAEDVVVVRAVV